MKRLGIAALCCVGILAGLTAVNATASSGKRDNLGSRQALSTDSAKHVRHARVQHTRAQHVKSKRLARKITGSHRNAKAGLSRLRVFKAGKPVQKGGGIYRVGSPYVIGGRTYTPKIDPTYRAEGKSSWYGDSFHGRLTANGEKFDMRALSAAHPTLPLPSYVRVTNHENQKSLIVRVNDRGPYHSNRLIDVSVRTAELLGFHDQGVAKVRVEFIGPAELTGSDDAKLVATLQQ